MAIELDESFFQITGDPFVDAGGIALEFLCKQLKDKSFEEIIDFSSDIFIEKWLGKINSLQLNSNITHNTKTGSKEKREKARGSVKEYFEDIFGDGKNAITEGYCRTCGSFGKLYKSGREQFCLSGSGKFVNFHHSHEEGLMLCNKCSTRLFFLPLIVIQLGGNMGLLHIQSEIIKKYWIEQTIRKNLDSIGRNNSTGIIKSDFTNPRNAVFKIVSEMILQFEADNEYLKLFHFTNFGATPDCDIHVIPNKVFLFIRKVIRSCSNEWFTFVRRHYHIKKTEWDYKAAKWISKQGVLEDEEYKNNKNSVYEKLLAEKSILPIMCRFYKDNYLKGINISSLMVDYYLKEVRNMDQERMDLIKRLGKSIIEIARKENNFKKYLTKIEGAGKAYQLRSVIISLVKKNYALGEKDPLITLNEYVDYLFPDGQFWGEVRDLLLIYLYELLHEENIKGIEVEEIELEEPDEELSEI